MRLTLGDRILKVNHAGEHGAVHIYAGQRLLARFTAPAACAGLADKQAHETRHRAIFAAELARRAVPRCRSYWLCAMGGYFLGICTGLLGVQAITATTVAVERVVLVHLQQQLQTLQGRDSAATETIEAILADEQAHHDDAAAQLKPGQFWPRLLDPLVAGATSAVIWLGMRF
ncbi:demethoxyubiquinone hydroxylase family protein [Chitinimonas viridis]|uniref:Demethoxyubiquinone hydroxylase family protein n=1 Tax=Chitinimonas viridis TaxID=664880 RepID=A0ABT8B8G8_9NEIS|nr:demethoxyubiquinone hydroxylase family protein [Chitinimonas viridis]MDN3577799.1 demethoxyubiquinone hydroxylase family protein [Chitinimonas viridis]